ncbi:MAG: ice-binding family protein [Pseudomonadota bacterium]
MMRKMLIPMRGCALLALLSFAACGDSSNSGDTTPPTVLSSTPIEGAIGVPVNATVSATFSEAMDPLSITTESLILRAGMASVAGTVSFAQDTARFTPGSALAPNTSYSALVTTGAHDLANNALAAEHTWSFTTGSTTDTTAPTVLSTIPASGAQNAAPNRSIRVTFSEAMNPSTLTADSFSVLGPGAARVAGTVTCSGAHATFSPLAGLALDSLYSASITTAVEDLAGNHLAGAFSWSFTTSATQARGPDPVLLGRAGDYAILAKSGVDTVPTSSITGDVGVSPIDSTALTGFALTLDASIEFATSVQVIGHLRAADYSPPTPAGLTTAVSDMETAYTDAAGRPTPDFTNLGAGEVGGLTLAPGLYKWGTGVAMSADVTLDGGPNDVWIFQIAGDVTQASGTRVILSGGALPENIFWQTFGQTMIGTNAHLEGIVLCKTAIILGTGASVNGRLLAQTAVTLDQSVVRQPPI